MSSKRRQRERQREPHGETPRASLLQRSRQAGRLRLGVPVVVLLALAFVLWLIFDVAGVRF